MAFFSARFSMGKGVPIHFLPQVNASKTHRRLFVVLSSIFFTDLKQSKIKNANIAANTVLGVLDS